MKLRGNRIRSCHDGANPVGSGRGPPAISPNFARGHTISVGAVPSPVGRAMTRTTFYITREGRERLAVARGRMPWREFAATLGVNRRTVSDMVRRPSKPFD